MPWKKQDREIPEGKGYYETDEMEERDIAIHSSQESSQEQSRSENGIGWTDKGFDAGCGMGHGDVCNGGRGVKVIRI